MEEKKTSGLYKIAFFTLLGINVGFCIGYSVAPKDEKIIVQDSVPAVISDTAKTANLNDELTDSTLIELLKRKGIRHPQIVLAQAKLETGNYTSRVCREQNNLFGLMKNANTYYTFDHWHDSVDFYKERIQSRYKGGDYYAFLERIGYAGDPHYTKRLKKIVRTM